MPVHRGAENRIRGAKYALLPPTRSPIEVCAASRCQRRPHRIVFQIERCDTRNPPHRFGPERESGATERPLWSR